MNQDGLKLLRPAPLNGFCFCLTGVGSKEIVEEIKSYLNGFTKGRTVQKTETNYRLRETSVSYNGLLVAKNVDIGAENAYFWNISA